jgi:hypothetical protein
MSAGLQERKRLRPASVDSPSIGISALRLVAFLLVSFPRSAACLLPQHAGEGWDGGERRNGCPPPAGLSRRGGYDADRPLGERQWRMVS